MSNYKQSTFCIQGLSPEFCKWMVDQGIGHYWKPELIENIDELRTKKMDIGQLFKDDMIRNKTSDKQ